MTRATAAVGISSHHAIDQAECDRTWDLLLQNRARWTERPVPGAPDAAVFHTFGRASYIDVSASPDPEGDYYSALSDTNAILSQDFAWLLERVRLVLADALQAPVGFLEGLALPGFHIFDCAAIGGQKTARVHFDLQYAALRFPVAPDFGSAISFTLPIVLPKCGGGLDVWNVTHEEYLRATRGRAGMGPDVFARRRRPRRVGYRPGRLVLQRRHLLHRIATMRPVRATDRRVTLQGHGLRFGGAWKLYW